MRKLEAVLLTLAALIGGYACLPQAPVQQTAEKPDEARRSPRWPKVRADFLKVNPACAACGIKDKDALEVHHVVPFHVDRSRELSWDNLIVLCDKGGHSCHHRLGHCFDWRAWNSHVREDAALQLKRIKERKYAP